MLLSSATIFSSSYIQIACTICKGVLIDLQCNTSNILRASSHSYMVTSKSHQYNASTRKHRKLHILVKSNFTFAIKSSLLQVNKMLSTYQSSSTISLPSCHDVEGWLHCIFPRFMRRKMAINLMIAIMMSLLKTIQNFLIIANFCPHYLEWHTL